MGRLLPHTFVYKDGFLYLTCVQPSDGSGRLVAVGLNGDIDNMIVHDKMGFVLEMHAFANYLLVRYQNGMQKIF